MDWDKLGTCIFNGPNGEKVASLNCFPALFINIINALLGFSGVVAVFLVIYSGIQFIISGGEAKQVEGARKTLTFAVMGLIVVLLSFLIINIIATLTGTECIKLFGFDNCKISSSTPTATPAPTPHSAGGGGGGGGGGSW